VQQGSEQYLLQAANYVSTVETIFASTFNVGALETPWHTKNLHCIILLIFAGKNDKIRVSVQPAT